MSRSFARSGWRLALTALALAAGPALAQTHSHNGRTCGTPSPTQQEVLASVVQAEQWLAAHPDIIEQQRGGVVTIPLAVHIISSGPSPAQGNVPDSQIIAQVEVLNAAYLPMGFQFVLAFQQRVENADWANLTYQGADATAMTQALHLDVSRYLNTYFVPNITSPQGDLLGYATFPDAQAETNFRQGVINITGSLPGGNSPPYNLGDTATHEIGHWAGLYHTFQGGCGTGDGVNDTPAEASSAFGCPTGRDTCPAPGLDPITNFMDYTDDSCMFEFTPGQNTRALALMNQFRPTIMSQSGALLADNTLTFEELYVGADAVQTVRLVNISQSAIEITGVTSSNAAFSAGSVPSTIPIGGTLDLEVTFAPVVPGAVTGTLTIATSDPNTPTLTVTATGSAQAAASVAFSTSAFFAAAAPGATTTRTLTLANGGPAVLNYTFGGSARAAAVPALAEAGLDAGGPDDFGYAWLDSNEPGGPVYDWVDIVTTGTVIALANDGSTTVPLPFAFPYYGQDRTTARIVSNGWIGFAGSGTGNASFNTTLPSSAAPNDLLAVFWDNLNPAIGGEVRYQNMGDGRFVVSWLAVPLATGSGTLTFQAILSANGRIRYQYQSMTASTTSATIGIENATGTDGLQVAYNETYVANGLAVEFKALPDWLSVAPEAGTVAVGSQENVTLTMDATELETGAYQELLDLTTNDPTVPQPTRIHVVFAVGDILAPPALTAPLYGDDEVNPTAGLAWLAAAGATGYEWQVATDEEFTAPVASGTSATPGASASLATLTTYYWRVRSTDGTTPSSWSLAFPFTTSMATADETGAERAETTLGALYPNPTRGAVTIPFTLAAADAAVTVRVLDVTGREVAVLADGAPFGAGSHRVEWNASGLPAGVYLVQVQAGGQVATGRVTVLR